jgi:hypothetical protein
MSRVFNYPKLWKVFEPREFVDLVPIGIDIAQVHSVMESCAMMYGLSFYTYTMP